MLNRPLPALSVAATAVPSGLVIVRCAATGLSGHGGLRTIGHPSTTVTPLMPAPLTVGTGGVGAGGAIGLVSGVGAEFGGVTGDDGARVIVRSGVAEVPVAAQPTRVDPARTRLTMATSFLIMAL